MCVACVAAASPEVTIALGTFAVARFGRPVARIRRWREGPQATAATTRAPDASHDQAR